ncbi:hypothetical protein Aph01nite_60450 [Acrocarpospora phusangensis]|uniref:Coenzyme Q-binding protein COQ10 START domain-containing protein n=1 Tax=Acrocarpospora phusangensis TaxID=1070424 RepID=A0A919QHY2_9ACTN|nr:cyclase [Acrocarpospora phusangensis]GIH27735.1 hypothetical protein Aph01nite_60450 [Acrocarpospora phusangensis]
MAGPKVSDAEKLDQAAEKVEQVSAADQVGQVSPTDRLVQELRNLVQAYAERALLSAGKVEGLAGRLTDFAEGGGSGLINAITGAKKSDRREEDSSDEAQVGQAKRLGRVKGAVAGGLGGLGRRIGRMRMTDIVETIDIGAPVRVVYNQFEDCTGFMTKANLQQESEESGPLGPKMRVVGSDRTWEPEVVDRVPDQRIVWSSKGDKGHLDGVVTFHALMPDLTRVILAMEYQPQGLLQRVGNVCGVQGRRAQLELKHFAHHVMTQLPHHDETADEAKLSKASEAETAQREGPEETAEHKEEQRGGAEEAADQVEGPPDARRPEETEQRSQADEGAAPEEEELRGQAEEAAAQKEERSEERRLEREPCEAEGVPESVVVRERPQGVGVGRPVRRRNTVSEEEDARPTRSGGRDTRTR